LANKRGSAAQRQSNTQLLAQGASFVQINCV
jgi:hypothetical protein